jgi:hypothetical protein
MLMPAGLPSSRRASANGEQPRVAPQNICRREMAGDATNRSPRSKAL